MKTSSTHPFKPIIIKAGGHAFVLSPDLEGVQPEALTLALKEMHPRMWDDTTVTDLVKKASEGKGMGTAKRRPDCS